MSVNFAAGVFILKRSVLVGCGIRLGHCNGCNLANISSCNRAAKCGIANVTWEDKKFSKHGYGLTKNAARIWALTGFGPAYHPRTCHYAGIGGEQIRWKAAPCKQFGPARLFGNTVARLRKLGLVVIIGVTYLRKK